MDSFIVDPMPVRARRPEVTRTSPKIEQEAATEFGFEEPLVFIAFEDL